MNLYIVTYKISKAAAPQNEPIFARDPESARASIAAYLSKFPAGSITGVRPATKEETERVRILNMR